MLKGPFLNPVSKFSEAAHRSIKKLYKGFAVKNRKGKYLSVGDNIEFALTDDFLSGCF